MPGFLDNAIEALKRARTPQPALRERLGPLTEAGMPMAPAGNVGRLAGSLGDILNPQTEVVMERMHQAARPAFKALEKAGTFAGDRTVGGLRTLGNAAKVGETLGEVNPEFTAVGGEGFYNVAKKGLQKITDPLEAAYNNILRNGGR